jgi:hypothetical protein
MQEKNKHTMRKLVTNVCVFIPISDAPNAINLTEIIIRYIFQRIREIYPRFGLQINF